MHLKSVKKNGTALQIFLETVSIKKIIHSNKYSIVVYHMSTGKLFSSQTVEDNFHKPPKDDNSKSNISKLKNLTNSKNLSETTQKFSHFESLTNLPSATTTIKRYKMERNNSQQSQHGKDSSLVIEPKVSTLSQECYSSVMDSLVNNQNVQVKIADLGNACYDVSLKKKTNYFLLFIF